MLNLPLRAAPGGAVSAAANAFNMAAALGKQQYLTQVSPKLDANFYLYLSTASWCPPCRELMPQVIAEYERIKEAGGELILINFDRTAKAASKYLSQTGADIPTIHTSPTEAEDLGLPGYKVPRRIPNYIMVNGHGRVLKCDHGANILTWQCTAMDNNLCGSSAGCQSSCTPSLPLNGFDMGKAVSTPYATVSEALAPHSYISEARPATDARFYIILCAASTCDACRVAIPGIVEQYASIKAAGGELVLLCQDSTPQKGIKFMTDYEMPFPVLMCSGQQSELMGIPGYTRSNYIPVFKFLTPEGELITEASGHSIHLWEDCLDKMKNIQTTQEGNE